MDLGSRMRVAACDDKVFHYVHCLNQEEMHVLGRGKWNTQTSPRNERSYVLECAVKGNSWQQVLAGHDVLTRFKTTFRCVAVTSQQDI